jgi:hydroxymethylbilane synthase
MNVVRIATRGSDLALAQANGIAERIRRELGRRAELVVVRTTGDRIQDRSLAKIGGKGLFVKEIEEALLDGRADVAVHSGKDLPARIAPGCALAAFPERADPRDALVAGGAATLAGLRAGARVGTGSTRRTAQLRAARPDLEIVPLRGNVPTRIAKLQSEQLDAVVLACAGLDRLGLEAHVRERIAPEAMLPAVCQGTLALETRADDPLRADIARLEDPEVALAARAERAFLGRLGGDCTTPVAAFADRAASGDLELRALLASEDGRTIARAEAAARDPEALGIAVAEQLLGDGGSEILAALAAR